MAASTRAGVSRVRDADAPPLPLAPIEAATVLTDRPSFVWTAVPDAREYDVQLFRGDITRKERRGRSRRSAQDHRDYPQDQPALSRDGMYTWVVSAPGKGGVARGRFAVATQDQASDFDSIRKRSRRPEVADRLLAAMLFEAGGVSDASHRLFEDLARQLPAEPWVLPASARHLARLSKTEEARARDKQAQALARRPR